MLWLAGEPVVGVAINPNPVRMINMSFGGSGACGGAYQEAFDTLRGKGILPVVAAGNSSADVSSSAPANCRGAFAVAASDITGTRAWFSNFGTGVALTAPGVDILSTSGPISGSCVKSGTSMAAPHVTAAAALVQAEVPTLTVNQTHLALRAGARAFPSGSNCTTANCGAGLLDVSNSLDAVIGSVARLGWNEQAATLRENDGNVSFTVSRIGGASQPVSVSVVADNGSAVAGVDFSAPSPATLTWAANDTTDRTVTVPIIYRPGEQGARAFALRLNAPSPSALIVAPAAVSVRITEVDCATVTPILMDETKAGSLDVAHPENYCHGGVRGPEFNTVRYSFDAVAGDVVSIDVTSTTALPAVLDPYVYLLGPNREVLIENDDIVSGSSRDSRIQQFQLSTTGTHYIDVTTWGSSADATGSYNVHLYSCGPYVAGVTCNVDADGDGIVDKADAQLVLRRLLGFDGATLTASSTFRACATRIIGSAVANFVDAQRVPVGGVIPLDIDGDGQVLATTDGLMLLRTALGLTGDAVVAGATAPGAPRSTWLAVRGYLNGTCGMTLP
ncbi:MAG: S8 family serine peptidase, partial [Casimicrobium sp.]